MQIEDPWETNFNKLIATNDDTKWDILIENLVEGKNLNHIS